MADPTSALTTPAGVPYQTEPGSVERQLVAAIDRIADLEETVRRLEAEVQVRFAGERRLATLEAEVPPLKAAAALFRQGHEILLFELYGADPADQPAWQIQQSFQALMAFSTRWANECVANGLQVEALDRAEGGVATADLTKQVRFNITERITGDARDIHAGRRGTVRWTLDELLVLRRSFVVAMETALGSRDASGAFDGGKPRVRGRLLFSFEQVPGFEVPYP